MSMTRTVHWKCNVCGTDDQSVCSEQCRESLRDQMASLAARKVAESVQKFFSQRSL